MNARLDVSNLAPAHRLARAFGHAWGRLTLGQALKAGKPAAIRALAVQAQGGHTGGVLAPVFGGDELVYGEPSELVGWIIWHSGRVMLTAWRPAAFGNAMALKATVRPPDEGAGQERVVIEPSPADTRLHVEGVKAMEEALAALLGQDDAARLMSPYLSAASAWEDAQVEAALRQMQRAYEQVPEQRRGQLRQRFTAWADTL